ncbi:MAG: 4'-phosphopantetheinyl transferase superfamily protein [Acidimicrobiales bacterium]
MIDLYWVDLRVGADEEAAWATLAPDETARADRFIFEADRRRFVAGRAAVRSVLGERLDLQPAEVRLSVDEWGKPVLAGVAGGPSFNVSHSGDVAVVAVADGRSVGVDVEVLRPGVGDLDVARRLFSPAERAALGAVAPEDVDAAFLRVWTRKEAWVKAKGQGLSIPLHTFDVSVGPDDATLRRAEGDSLGPSGWWLHDVSGARFGAPVVAAIAAPGPACPVVDRRVRWAPARHPAFTWSKEAPWRQTFAPPDPGSGAFAGGGRP